MSQQGAEGKDMTQDRIELQPGDFAGPPRVIAARDGITVTGFAFGSGVAGLRIVTPQAEVVVLPFQGQQVWDAVVCGRRLTMQTDRPEPLPTRDYQATNGAFLIHCGGSAMGNPGPGDDHPLHGELPNLPYEAVELTVWPEMVVLTGAAWFRAPGGLLVARPQLRIAAEWIGAESILFTAGIALSNEGPGEVAVFYLAHLNFRPMDGARIIDSDPAPLLIRDPGLDANTPDRLRRWHDAVATDPERHRIIAAGDVVLPEFVATLRPGAGPDGWHRSEQRHPDGRADVVLHRPADLPVVTRWMQRGAGKQALGFCLPGTTAPDGRTAGLRTGQAVILPPGGGFVTEFMFGAG